MIPYDIEYLKRNIGEFGIAWSHLNQLTYEDNVLIKHHIAEYTGLDLNGSQAIQSPKELDLLIYKYRKYVEKFGFPIKLFLYWIHTGSSEFLTVYKDGLCHAGKMPSDDPNLTKLLLKIKMLQGA